MDPLSVVRDYTIQNELDQIVRYKRQVPVWVTLVPINYTPTIDEVKKSKDLLEDMTIRKYLVVLHIKSENLKIY